MSSRLLDELREGPGGTTGWGTRMRIAAEQEEERDALRMQILKADSREEIAAARRALDAWFAEHPDDLGLVDGYEHLLMCVHALDVIEAGAVNVPRPVLP